MLREEHGEIDNDNETYPDVENMFIGFPMDNIEQKNFAVSRRRRQAEWIGGCLLGYFDLELIDNYNMKTTGRIYRCAQTVT